MRFALTTFDNPYDPFEQFTQWFMFDEEKGYHTTAYLGRIARTSDQLSDEELIGYLTDDDRRFAFLTPVGTEIGFNYDEGWITVTMKENIL